MAFKISKHMQVFMISCDKIINKYGKSTKRPMILLLIDLEEEIKNRCIIFYQRCKGHYFNTSKVHKNFKEQKGINERE